MTEKPKRPSYVRKFGKTVGTAQHSTVEYRGRLMRQDVAERCYQRDLAKWNSLTGGTSE